MVWKSKERERCAIFNCYNTIGSKWHTWEPPEAVLATMPPKRQSLFRPVYCQNNTVSPDDKVDPGNGVFPSPPDRSGSHLKRFFQHPRRIGPCLDCVLTRPKKSCSEVRTALCVAGWGYQGADELEQFAEIEPDAVWLEGEHGDVDFSNLGNVTRAVDLTGAAPIVRVHQNQAGVIYRTLDSRRYGNRGSSREYA